MNSSWTTGRSQIQSCVTADDQSVRHSSGTRDQFSSFFKIIFRRLQVCSSPLWPSCQSSWLRIQRSGFDSRRYQIFWDVVGLERGPLSLVSTIEELLGRKNSGSGLESQEYGRGDPSRWPRGTLFPQKLALILSISDRRSVDIVSSRTQATELLLLY
jgi:hypothetical protein